MLDESYGLGSWRVTPEQAERIRAHSMPDIVLFLEENDSLIDFYAKSYASKKQNSDYGYTVEDMKQQLFLDLPFFESFGFAGVIVSNMRRSFYYSALGGWAQLRESSRNSLEHRHFSHENTDNIVATGEDGEEYSVIDRFVYEPAPEDVSDMFRCVKPIDIKLLFRDYMSPRVYTYFCHRMDGYAMREALRKMRVSITCSSYHRNVRYAIAAHYDELLYYLATHESDYTETFVKLGREFLQEIKANQSKEKEKAYKGQKMRRESIKDTEAYKEMYRKRNNTPERKAYMTEYRRKRREAAIAAKAAAST